MMNNFSDARVGYVTGKMIYVNELGKIIGDGCSSYMKFENFLYYLDRIKRIDMIFSTQNSWRKYQEDSKRRLSHH